MNADKEKQQKINEIVRYIAYKVFYMKGDYKFTHAYDKLHSRVLIDHNFNISRRIKALGRHNITTFDVLHGNELNLVLDSAISLLKMYEEVIERKLA